MALAAYAIEYGCVQQLTAAQLDLARKVVKVLGCVEEITKSYLNRSSINILDNTFYSSFSVNIGL